MDRVTGLAPEGRGEEGVASIDVSRLPTVVFGSRGLMWWGTMAFMVIEGWTLALTAMSWFYLRQSSEHWPPLRTPNPSLLIPTINMALMIASLFPAWWTARRAKELDRRGVIIGLAISGALGAIILWIRWYELWAINTRWDTNAYGSVAWLIVGLHMTLLLLDVADTIGLGVKFAAGELPPHFYSDTSDNTTYWFFTVLGWVPLYLIVYVAPYFL
jgi:heme/copper-type cytochrome/quinol oxidase subunit 3